MAPKTLKPAINGAKEIKEISEDFLQPLEVLREALSNAYDAGALKVHVVARREHDATGRNILSLSLTDDGQGMSRENLEGFFGLGVSHKPRLPDRPPIGFKGHGTKLYYRARDIYVLTRRADGPTLLAVVENAREQVLRAQDLPAVELWEGEAAEQHARAIGLAPPAGQGTAIALLDFTADSNRLIDAFRRKQIESYIRWFTVYGSFQYIITKTEPRAPFELTLQATDEDVGRPVPFGHPWPSDATELRELKAKDARRPYNHFVKTFAVQGLSIEGGDRIDIAVAFEGRAGRLARDPGIRRQRNSGDYHEDERYGLWLGRNHIPVELRSDWLRDEGLGEFAHIDPKRALVLVNCNEFKLTANRGSVHNSQAALLSSVRRSVVEYLAGLADDAALRRFLDEYEEEQRTRLREKDRKALDRRITRYNRKKVCRFAAADGTNHEFFEPDREITFYGLLRQLEIWDPGLVELDVLDYDDHRGLDLLVRVDQDPSDLLSRDRIAYAELKHTLEAHLNHAFALLRSIVCWDNAVRPGGTVLDATGTGFVLAENQVGGVTYSSLIPSSEDKRHKHTVEVIVVRRLLEETRGLVRVDNPRRINGRH
jgi:Histidine kinase-, DNA gyrase B-, and HSP90-like ATPase